MTTKYKENMVLRKILLGGLVILGLGACQGISEPVIPADTALTNPEIQIIELPLDGASGKTDAEYSGLAWFGDHLVLLPQFPSRFENNLWVIPKSQILAFLDGRSKSLSPQKLAFNDEGIKDEVRGFEGYEALIFNADTVYLTIESDAGSTMICYVVQGQIEADLSMLRLNPTTLQEIPHPVDIDNMCAEALLIWEGEVITFFEANGANINPHPLVHRFDSELILQGESTLPNIEYRLTDVTASDAAGRFWALNYMFPGDKGKLDPGPDQLAAQLGVGSSHAGSEAVERLIEFEITAEGIALTDTAPIWLRLLPDEARNWEGLARLDERGFLLITDKFPDTILAFVPFPSMNVSDPSAK